LKPIIYIGADFGNAPYAWLKESINGVIHSSNIADFVTGFPDEYGVSSGLDEKLGKWAVEFECKCDDPGFDWDRWNGTGIELARELKKELGGRFRVFYAYPCEDPNYDYDTSTFELY